MRRALAWRCVRVRFPRLDVCYQCFYGVVLPARVRLRELVQVLQKQAADTFAMHSWTRAWNSLADMRETIANGIFSLLQEQNSGSLALHRPLCGLTMYARTHGHHDARSYPRSSHHKAVISLYAQALKCKHVSNRTPV